MEPLIWWWTFITSIRSPGQYHRWIERRASAWLSSRQVLNGISEPAAAVFLDLWKVYAFYQHGGELAECWKHRFHFPSLFMRQQPQAMTTWQILFWGLSPEQGVHIIFYSQSLALPHQKVHLLERRLAHSENFLTCDLSLKRGQSATLTIVR